MAVFFTADLHFGHKNIIKYDKRPFKDVQEMEDEMVARWNAAVRPEDTVYMLGDVLWTRDPKEGAAILDRLNGHKRLIVGNHDGIILDNPSLRAKFDSIKPYDEVVIKLEDGETRKCVLSHYFIPLFNGFNKGAILLHGHSHISPSADLEADMVEFLKFKGIDVERYNVGCMYYYYRPVTLDEILFEREIESQERILLDKSNDDDTR